jgi:hypothetical protein
MPLINDKGKLLGIVNPFDLLAGIVLLGSGALILAGFLIPDLADRALTQHAEWREYRVTVVSQNPRLMAEVKLDDLHVNRDGEELIRVLSREIATFGTLIDPMIEHPRAEEPVLVLELKVRAKLWPDDIPTLGHMQIIPGEILQYNTKQYVFWGTIHAVEPYEPGS